MGVEQDLRRWLAGEQAEPVQGEEQAWNILVQVLLPLVFVLTFVIITSVHAYRTAAEAAWEILDKDEDLASLQLKETLLELQLQKLLKALGEVEADEESRLGLGLFPTPDRVRRDGPDIRDESFRGVCQAGLEAQRDMAPPWADRLYLQVLAAAAMTDPHPLPVRRWPEASSELDRAQTQLAEPGVVTPRNRRILHHHVLDFVAGVEERLVELQSGLVAQIFRDLQSGEAVAEADTETRAWLEALAAPDTTEAEREKLATNLYRHLLQGWQRELVARGYELLPQTWERLGL